MPVVIVTKPVERRYIFFNIREAPYRFVEIFITAIIITFHLFLLPVGNKNRQKQDDRPV